MVDSNSKYTNHLINEQSPYLQQHAHNPVNWRAWNEESFAVAEREDKPIFLSIGYATCHWCHVMERESFEDEEVAALLNDKYISIKLDREERPDIDAAYMDVCQAMTGHGGWPLTILMMPDKKPFFAGTYFPKRSTFGRAGIIDILSKIAQLWENERPKIIESSSYIYNSLSTRAQQDFYLEFSADILVRTVEIFSSNFDKDYGGFRQSPKFPSPHQLCFLLRMYRRTGEKSTLDMVMKTLRSMRNGGIFDHIGYGFHRYSTDEKWLLPHFEKMLYDQAWLAIAYIEAYQLTKDEDFRRVAESILEYVSEKLTSPNGGFYSAEDADSEGVEGKFYVWTFDEIIEILGKEDAQLFMDVYGIEPDGNFREEATGNQTSENIPHLENSIEEYALQNNISSDVLRYKLEVIRVKLWKKRKERIHPLLDDKILTDWNGMMIAAYSKAAAAFQEPNYSIKAETAWQFISTKLMRSDGRLLHRFRNNEAAIPAFLDDYVAVGFGLFELYQATGNEKYLLECIRITDKAIALFEDENGGFFQSERGTEDTPFSNHKQVYDGAIPSGNSMMVHNLFRLGTALQRNDLVEHGLKAIYSFGKQIEQYSAGFTWLLSALEYFTGSRQEIVVQGNTEELFIVEAIQRLQQEFLPTSVILYAHNSTTIPVLTNQFEYSEENPCIHVCENYYCSIPMTSMEQFEIFITKETTIRGNEK
jgi:uncharacterized protein YyaL (SSP411 family)